MVRDRQKTQVTNMTFPRDEELSPAAAASSSSNIEVHYLLIFRALLTHQESKGNSQRMHEGLITDMPCIDSCTEEIAKIGTGEVIWWHQRCIVCKKLWRKKVH
jgi:Fe-S-cluster-containing hydrogenase component 2